MKRLLILAFAVLFTPGAARADERSTARRFETAKRDEPSLIAFLRAMPKGGDLHNHAGGALWLEQGLDEAVRRGLFFNPSTNLFEPTRSEKNVPASQLLTDSRLRYRFLNSGSVRGDISGPAAGHDFFFDAFGPSNTPWQRTPDDEVLASLVKRARLQNVQYLELMFGIGGAAKGRLEAAARGEGSWEARLQRMQPLVEPFVQEAKAELDLLDRGAAEKAGVPPPISAPGGPITVRYMETAFRVRPDEQVFARWAAAFFLMKRDARVVGANLAAAEDEPVAREAFGRQLKVMDFLWQRFDHPNVSLHAGELNLFLSPLEDMTRHIRDSIEIGHARRIGHGTDVAWEDDAHGLLRLMRQRGIAVEVCPSSEAVILGMEGDRHPFRFYQRAGVPVTINTDDEGILRTNLTMEFVRAVRSWGLSYGEVKELVRNSLEYSFLPGESLWLDHDYRRPRKPFRGLRDRGWASVTGGEKQALGASDRAAVQVRLERALVEFEE